MTDESAGKFIRSIMESGHTSVLEHAVFTFAVEGVSRALLAQLTRHRIASFSVQSQRYVDMNGVSMMMPDAISKNPSAKRVFDDVTDEISRAYRDIHAYLLSGQLYPKYHHLLDNSPDLSPELRANSKYFYLALDAKMKSLHEAPEKNLADEMTYAAYKRDRSAAEKFANENARAILPNAAKTNLTVTMNARELQHFFSLRCCNRAQDEIRELADKMLVLCKQVAPTIFEKSGAPCLSGPCPEGSRTCGHPRTEGDAV